jgi:hypothetical protein
MKKKKDKMYKSESIKGWGFWLNNELKDLFGEEALETVGCSSQTCRHESHDPEVAMVLLRPRGGVELFLLGVDREPNASTWYYLVKTEKGEEIYLEVSEPLHNHGTIEIIKKEEVPDNIRRALPI